MKSSATERFTLFGLLLFLVFSFSGCGEEFRDLTSPDDNPPPAETDEDDDGDGEEAEEPEPITEVQLEAAKHYGPSRWENDLVDLEGELFELLIPAQIEVVSGNGGNHWSKIRFDGVECRYKGGSSQSKPLKGGNQRQIELGQLYHFQHCLDESDQPLDLVSGDVIEASETLFLGVDNGDSTESTVITVTVQVAE